MLTPIVIACYFRLMAGLRGNGEKTFIEEIRVFGWTLFIMYCFNFFIDWLFKMIQ